MALKGKPLLLTTSDQDVYVCPATQEASVHALVFSNVTGGAITISIKRYISATASTTQLVAALSVAANSTFNWPKPMNMAVGDKIIASASANSSIVCDYGAYENSATPAAVGFTGRGAWSSGSTYAINDVVTVSGSSYLAIQASTNQNPTTATSFWMLLASKGDTGASGTGTVNSVTGGTGLTGGTITTTGTLAIDTSVVATLGDDQTITGSKRGAVSTANSGSFDMNAANNFLCTPTAGVTLTFTNITAGQSGLVTLVNPSAYTISKAAAVKMTSTALATISAAGTYLLSYHSPDGTNVYVSNVPGAMS
jgi:hypothetical protein